MILADNSGDRRVASNGHGSSRWTEKVAKFIATFSEDTTIDDFRETYPTQHLIILFTDLEGSTGLKADLGTLPAVELEDRHRDLLEQAREGIPSHGVRVEGDSHIYVFQAHSDAIRFALRAQALHRDAHGTDPNLPPFRVGIHSGEVVVESDSPGRIKDVKGIQADITARIMGLATGGRILCSRHVFDDARQILKGTQIPGVGELEWRNHGPYVLKGREDAVEICEVRETGTGVSERPARNEKAWPA